MNTQERLIRARILLLNDHPFFGTLALRLAMVEDATVCTLSVNSKRMRYSPAFVGSISDAELQGCLAHEILHVANGHSWRRGNRDKEQWNEAGDHAINGILTQCGMTLPKTALEGMDGSAESIYAALQTNAHDAPGSAGNPDPAKGQPGGRSLNVGQPGASESRSSKESADGNPQDGKKGGKTGCKGVVSNVAPETASDGVSQETGKASEDPGGCGVVEDEPADEAKQAEAEWRVAVAQAAMAAKGRGDLPGNLAQMVDEIVNTKVNWAVLLRDFLERTARNDYNWSRPSVRFLNRGVVLPGLVSEELPRIVLVIDTSGSVWSKALEFATESSAVLGAYDTTIELLYVDTQVCGHEVLTRADLPIKLQPKGGGGTSFIPAFDWVACRLESPAALVYLTDLDGRFPEKAPEYPVLWVCTEKGKTAPFGEVVYLE